MSKNIFLPILLFFILFMGCSSEDTKLIVDTKKSIQYLALGDSYTIGEGVCWNCNFPSQLKDSLLQTDFFSSVNLKIVAQTGWTTTNLKNAIEAENLNSSYDLVTILIGVNNQYQNRPFSLYETEFPELLQTAITLAKGDKNRVIVVSIPDYAFTPFGQSSSNPSTISNQLDNYNTFAKNHAESLGISFLNITDITREGLNNPNLVASDNLHPSQLAYSKFVERMFPIALEKLNVD
ncbi:MAG: SGNH/GDSL hydrolase family protein [Flavobacterium sp.]|jgi:lysophospholipase L1-like esterase|uniref:SGNH/GDSL hydrolase family protein n=1 Tax=Flavobacterium sp. TaxID=239 RepID=UPI003BA44AB1